MLKKIMKLAMEIGAERMPFPVQYEVDGKFYIVGTYRIIGTKEMFPDVPVMQDKFVEEKISHFMNLPQERNQNGDYHRHDVTAEFLRNGIRETCGRKRDPVAWMPEETGVGVNARFLVSALEAVKENGYYYRGRVEPLFVYDNWQEPEVAVTIMPVWTTKTGFHAG